MSSTGQSDPSPGSDSGREPGPGHDPSADDSSAHDPSATPGPVIDAETWAAAQSSPEFATLRLRLRKFVFPVSAIFLVWYLIYVLLADYAHGFMSIKLVGNINVGLVLGLLQFVSTFLITTLYVRYANKNLDPVAEQIRERVEGEQR